MIEIWKLSHIRLYKVSQKKLKILVILVIFFLVLVLINKYGKCLSLGNFFQFLRFFYIEANLESVEEASIVWSNFDKGGHSQVCNYNATMMKASVEN